MKQFILTQFGYCPLIWMCHSRKVNNRINRLHERALRVVYQDNSNSFTDLLMMDGCFTIHQRNVQSLAIELYKTTKGLIPEFMTEIFTLKADIKYCSKQPYYP